MKRYLAEVRTDLFELKTSYGLDFGEENTPGFMLVSHIVLDKLPVSVTREISHRVSNNYPSLKQIFENYSDTIGALTITKKDQYTTQNRSHGKEQAVAPNFRYYGKDEATLQNFATSTQELQCKLCDTRGHNMGCCDKFTTYIARIQRCLELNLCIHCNSRRHKSEKCLGIQNKLRYACKHCPSRSHVTPPCNN